MVSPEGFCSPLTLPRGLLSPLTPFRNVPQRQPPPPTPKSSPFGTLMPLPPLPPSLLTSRAIAIRVIRALSPFQGCPRSSPHPRLPWSHPSYPVVLLPLNRSPVSFPIVFSFRAALFCAVSHGPSPPRGGPKGPGTYASHSPLFLEEGFQTPSRPLFLLLLLSSFQLWSPRLFSFSHSPFLPPPLSPYPSAELFFFCQWLLPF